MPPDPPPTRGVVKRDKGIAERYIGTLQDYLNAKVNTRSAPVLWTRWNSCCCVLAPS